MKVRRTSYIFKKCGFRRWKSNEEAALLDLGFSQNREHRGTHSPRLYFSGLAVSFSRVQRPNPSAIHIRRPFGRFGNQVFQILHALALARRWGVQEIIAPGNVVFERENSPIDLDGVDLYFSPGDITWGSSRASRIFPSLRNRFHLAYNAFFADHPGELEIPLTAVEFDRASEALATTWGKVRPKKLPDDHLVIHLRAGDVFSRDPNPLYGQPPLSFYEKVLAMKSWAFVSVVREDARHPLEKALSELLEATSAVFDFRSASLVEDIDFLRSATNLVSSRGTFVPAISSLSPDLERVFVFGPEGRFHSRIEVVRILDTTQRYWRAVCDSNWENSEAQRNLMASYPAKHLSVVCE